jgi:hypothetical protein
VTNELVFFFKKILQKALQNFVKLNFLKNISKKSSAGKQKIIQKNLPNH